MSKSQAHSSQFFIFDRIIFTATMMASLIGKRLDCMVKIILLSVFLCVISISAENNSTYGTCGDCWCVADNGGLDACPSPAPQTVFSDSVVKIYQQQVPSSIFTLACNPYKVSDCTTIPAQTMLDLDDAVCAYKYPDIDGGDGKPCSAYAMATYASSSAALADGAILTHAGSCGLCSTTQDLSIYLIEDFTTAGKKCATKGLFDEAAGLQCYMDIGLTEECAKIWNYDGIYDGKACGVVCVKELDDPNNGPPPACELNDCLQCDEDKAGPIFSSFAGRTRRRSGLLSEIVRPCSSIANITHNPCVNSNCQC